MKQFLSLILAVLSCLCAGAKPKYITYEKFGAKGDGITDDLPAIVAAHKAANAKGLPVKAKDGSTYYLGGSRLTAVIMTDTDFGKAHFIIDDTNPESIKTPVFEIKSARNPFKVQCRNVPSRQDSSVEMTLPCRCLVSLSDDSKKVYIRKGLNQNKGTAMSEVAIVDPDGSIDTSAALIWDYVKVPKATAYPIDENTLSVTGGTFTTIANQAESRYNYHDRGIKVSRSNVRISGMTHLVTGELDHGAPYTGFLHIRNVADILVENCVFTGHMTYRTIGSAKQPVSMGSYDISINHAINVTLRNCTQTTDIDDKTYWGLMGTNFCKNLTLENCRISRFDAHQGVRNVTLRNCEFGHMGVRMVGCGTILMENCISRYHTVIALRSDYGSTWEGDIIIRNCTLLPQNKTLTSLNILNGSNNGNHDFGYTCFIPEKIDVDGLVIDDSILAENPKYKGPSVFSNFGYKGGPEVISPVVAKGEVILRNVVVRSGKPLRDNDNPILFKDYVFTRE